MSGEPSHPEGHLPPAQPLTTEVRHATPARPTTRMQTHVREATVRLSIWDRTGIWLSGICMVHCLALPVMLLLVPLWPSLGPAHGWLHPAFAVMLIGTTLPAAFSAWRRHRSPGLAALLLAGLAVVMVAMLIGRTGGVVLEDGITLLGSAMLIAGHWKNGRVCATGTCTH